MAKTKPTKKAKVPTIDITTYKRIDIPCHSRCHSRWDTIETSIEDGTPSSFGSTLKAGVGAGCIHIQNEGCEDVFVIPVEVIQELAEQVK